MSSKFMANCPFAQFSLPVTERGEEAPRKPKLRAELPGPDVQTEVAGNRAALPKASSTSTAAAYFPFGALICAP